MSEQQYYQKRIKCGKKRCKKCHGEDSIGHGPYWYVRQKEGDHSVETYIGPHLPPNQVHIGRINQSSLVGREQELSQLHACITAVEARQKSKRKSSSADQMELQHVLLLKGDAGIGKTRLAEEVARLAGGRRWTVLWSRAYAQEGTIPYRLWIEVLQTVLKQKEWKLQEQVNESPILQPLTLLLPQLSSTNVSSSFPLEQEQLRLREAVEELLFLISASTPLLIVLDDLQWADKSSYDLLAYLARARQRDSHPFVILATYRTDEQEADHLLRPLLADLQRENALSIISLGPLSSDHILSLVSQVTQASEPMIQYITHHASGNPFFAEELARAIETQSTDMKSPESTLQVHLPDTITAALTLRLGRLSEACQLLLRKAATLGNSFEFQVITAMEEKASSYDEDVVLERLEEALTAGILIEEGVGNHVTYSFWHPLLASHLYERNSVVRRAMYHRRAADVLKKLYRNREDEKAAIITHHLVQGGADSQQIVYYAEIAGNQAYALSSYTEAAEQYRIALDHRRMVPAEHSKLPEGLLLEMRLLELMGECSRIQGKYEEARRWYEKALEIRAQQRLFDLSEEPHVDIQIQALLWCEIGFTWYNSGEWAKALDCYQQGEAILQEEGIVHGPTWAHLRYRQAYVSWRKGKYDEALAIAREALEWCDQSVALPQQKRRSDTSTLMRRILAGDPVSFGRIHQLLGMIANARGNYAETIHHWNAALKIFEQYASERDIAILACNLGDIHLRTSDHDQAQSALHRALALAEHIGETPLVSAILGNLGVLAIRKGELLEAEAKLRKGASRAEKTNDPVYTSILHSYLAVALLEQGKLSEAAESVCRALIIGRSMHIEPCIGLALVTLGALRQAQARDERQREEFSTVEMQNARQARFLTRSRQALQRALHLEIETETRIEAQLTLAHVLLLESEIQGAYHLASRSLQDACSSDLTWLAAQAQRILGTIAFTQGQDEQAIQQFEQAMDAFREIGMRLEYGRTLCDYGKMLQRRAQSKSELREGNSQLPHDYMKDSEKIFEECGALLEKQRIKSLA